MTPLRGEPEGRVAVGDMESGVRDDAVVPAQDALDVVETIISAGARMSSPPVARTVALVATAPLPRRGCERGQDDRDRDCDDRSKERREPVQRWSA